MLWNYKPKMKKYAGKINKQIKTSYNLNFIFYQD